MQKPAQKRMLQEFVRQFTDQQIYHELEIVSKSFYEVPKELKEITEKANQEFFCAGEFLGKIDRQKFTPSVELLKRLRKVTKNVATVNDQAAWLFVCGRDILDKGIDDSGVEEGVVIVLDRKDNILGYGILSYQHGVAIKNLWDLGDFLRRER